MLIIIGILVAIIIGLLIYNFTIHKKIQQFNSLNRQANNLRVLQDFLNTIGETSSVDEKIQKINDILIEKYEIKYSTALLGKNPRNSEHSCAARVSIPQIH